MRTCKPRLLPKDYAQVKCDGHDDGVGEETTQAKRDRPTEKNERDGYVDGISRIAIQAHDDEMHWRRPWGDGALARNVEVAHTPEQRDATNDKRNQAKRLDELRVRRCHQPDDRNRERNNARQCEECQQRSQEHSP